MSNQELFQALQMLQSGVKDLFTSRTINQAQEQVQQIKATEQDEAKQRQALSGVANELTMRLAGLGTPATTIDQVVGAVGPKQFANGDQAIMEGQLTGSSFLTQGGLAANRLAKQDEIGMANDTRAFQAAENAKNRALQLELAGLRGAGKAKAQHITDTQINKFADAFDTEQGFKELFEKVNNDGSLVGPIDKAKEYLGRGKYYDAEYGKFKMQSKQLFNKYRQMITGAGASEGEIKMLMESWPAGDETAEVYKAKLKQSIAIGRASLVNRVNALEDAGKDTSKLRARLDSLPTIEEITGEAQQATAPASPSVSSGKNLPVGFKPYGKQ